MSPKDIKIAMLEADVSAEELAEEFGVHTATIYAWLGKSLDTRKTCDMLRGIGRIEQRKQAAKSAA